MYNLSEGIHFGGIGLGLEVLQCVEALEWIWNLMDLWIWSYRFGVDLEEVTSNWNGFGWIWDLMEQCWTMLRNVSYCGAIVNESHCLWSDADGSHVLEGKVVETAVLSEKEALDGLDILPNVLLSSQVLESQLTYARKELQSSMYQ